MKVLNKILAFGVLLTSSYSSVSSAGLLDLGINLNEADRYTFAVGNHGSLLLGSEADVYGHVAAEFFVQLASGAKVHGDACANSPVSLGPLATVAGQTGNSGNCNDISNLTSTIFEVNSVAASLSGISLHDVNNTQTLFANNSLVYDVNNLTLETGEFLTINGGANDAVVINVAGDASIGSGAGILLDGGINANNVLFNFLDTNVVSNFEFGGAEISGTFLANNRSFQLGDGATLENVRFYTNASMQANVQVVQNPPHVNVSEPTSIVLLVTFLLILVYRNKFQRKYKTNSSSYS